MGDNELKKQGTLYPNFIKPFILDTTNNSVSFLITDELFYQTFICICVDTVEKKIFNLYFSDNDITTCIECTYWYCYTTVKTSLKACI